MELTSIEILTSIEDMAFAYNSSLSNISFKGTVAQWNSFSNADDWYEGIPATYIQCSDGRGNLS